MPDLTPDQRVYCWVDDRAVAGAICGLLLEFPYLVISSGMIPSY